MNTADSYIVETSLGVIVRGTYVAELSRVALHSVGEYACYFEYEEHNYSFTKKYGIWLYSSPEYAGNNKLNLSLEEGCGSLHLVSRVFSPVKRELFYTKKAESYEPCWNNIFISFLGTKRGYPVPNMLAVFR